MVQGNQNPETPAPGELRRVGPYRLLRKLAVSGMSTVYVAYDEASKQTVAVKVLAEHLKNQPEFVRRFRREARLLQLLRHPNIVKGLDSNFDREQNLRYLAMDFVDGPSAGGLLKSMKSLPAPIVARIGVEIAAALNYLHTIHFVHRDIKPDNLLIDHHGNVRLADFGLLKKIDGGADLTASNQGVGTPNYMPHEQAQNSSIVDGRSDLFALGASLYHLLTGELPFPGQTQAEVDRSKESGTFRAINPSKGLELGQVLAKAMHKEIRERYQTALELLHDLEPFAATPADLGRFIISLDRNQFQETDHHAPTRTDLPKNAPQSPSLINLPRVGIFLAAVLTAMTTWWGLSFANTPAKQDPVNNFQDTVTHHLEDGIKINPVNKPICF